MAQDIVSGLFGLTPMQVQQQQRADLAARANQYAEQDPLQRAAASMYQTGAGVAQIGAEGMLGMQNPAVAAAQQRQELGRGMDLTTPQGIYAAAKMAQDRGDVEMAAKLAAMARQAEDEQSTQAFRAAQTQQMLTPKSDMTSIEKLYAARERAAAAGNAQMVNSIDAAIRKETHIAGAGGGTAGVGVGGVTAPAAGQVVLDLGKAQGAKARKEHGEDWSKVKSVQDVAKSSTAKATALVNDADKMSSLFGRGYSGVVTSYMNPDARKKLEEVKNNLKATGMSIMKNTSDQSLGSMQVNEWPIMEAQIAAIDTTMSEKEAKDVITGIINRYAEWEKVNKEGYKNKWENYPQFYKPLDQDAASPAAGGNDDALINKYLK